MFFIQDVDQLYNQFSGKVYEAGFLDKKTKELIALACSVMADCVPCIEHHYQQSRSAGATQDEISEALAIAVSISGGSKRAKFSPVIEKLENETRK